MQKIKKIGRLFVAGSQLMFQGWVARAVFGEAGYQDFLSQLRTYVETGEVDTSWVSKYTG